MDPINPLNGIAELIRQRINAETATKRLGKSSHQAKTGEAERGRQRASVAELRGELSCALEAIDPDKPASRQKAIRIFVETVLVWQFGSGILNDPAFSELVGEVQATLDKDPSIARTLSSLKGGKQSTDGPK